MKSHAATANGRGSEFELQEIEPGRFVLQGELGFASVADALKKSARLFSGSSRAVFDLSGIVRVDSAGLALLLEWQRRAREAGVGLEYIHAPAQLLAIARVAGVDRIFS
ncbi:lipid asymmetry maintenance protein MlaB [Methylococcus sp. EFPC2]|uniref:STAS domain-containing protein n=1 Tax=Methylococcus sp. EFPC2 TaxID=2812648 RepID=UPI0019676E11|nr:STAS domain-containing protein [Methylococcus sp. EFPC2]QSA98712.1 STAS domain-containing protein [Methylococcus sp. EFPC2]